MKQLFHKVAIILFLLLILTAFDAMRGGFQSETYFRVLAGKSAPIGGKLDVSPEDLAEVRNFDPNKAAQYLTYTITSRDAEVELLELKGRIWRGVLICNADATPGEYRLTLMPRGGNPAEDATTYTVGLFADAASYRASLPSYCERRLGIKPVWLCLGLLPLALACLGISFLLSGREDAQRQARGLGPIYKLAKRKQSWEVIFGLGSIHGLHDGDRLLLLDRDLNVVGDLVAGKVSHDSARAEVGLDVPIKPDSLVALVQSPDAIHRGAPRG